MNKLRNPLLNFSIQRENYVSAAYDKQTVKVIL